MFYILNFKNFEISNHDIQSQDNFIAERYPAEKIRGKRRLSVFNMVYYLCRTEKRGNKVYCLNLASLYQNQLSLF